MSLSCMMASLLDPPAWRNLDPPAQLAPSEEVRLGKPDLLLRGILNYVPAGIFSAGGEDTGLDDYATRRDLCQPNGKRCWRGSCTIRSIRSWSRARERARDLCQELNATREGQHGRAAAILRELFGAGGDDVWMQPPFFCDYGVEHPLGQEVFFQFQLRGAGRVPGDDRRLTRCLARRCRSTRPRIR